MGLKLIFHSNSAWSASGYGVQARINVKRMQKMPEVEQAVVSSYWGLHGGVIEYDGIVHLPQRGNDFGNNDLQPHVYHTNSDVVIALMDSWILRDDIGQLGFLFCCWAPVDHDPIPPQVVQKLSNIYMPIAMSKHGYEQMINAGLKNVRYVPHAVETKVYRPHSAKVNRETRKRLGIPEDAFLIGTVAANKGYPARKSWPQMLEAVGRFIQNHPNAYFYAHTLATTEHEGVDISGVAKVLGVGDRLILPNPYLYLQGFPDKEMSKIYSCFDVFLLPSMGEGFGVPQIEAQACGVPVIVTDFAASSELIGAGQKVSVGYRWFTPLYSYQALPDIASIVQCLENNYNLSRKERKEQGRQAREFSLQYDVDLIFDTYWKPIIQELEMDTRRQIIA